MKKGTNSPVARLLHLHNVSRGTQGGKRKEKKKKMEDENAAAMRTTLHHSKRWSVCLLVGWFVCLFVWEVEGSGGNLLRGNDPLRMRNQPGSA